MSEIDFKDPKKGVQQLIMEEAAGLAKEYERLTGRGATRRLSTIAEQLKAKKIDEAAGTVDQLKEDIRDAKKPWIFRKLTWKTEDGEDTTMFNIVYIIFALLVCWGFVEAILRR